MRHPLVGGVLMLGNRLRPRLDGESDNHVWQYLFDLPWCLLDADWLERMPDRWELVPSHSPSAT